MISRGNRGKFTTPNPKIYICQRISRVTVLYLVDTLYTLNLILSRIMCANLFLQLVSENFSHKRSEIACYCEIYSMLQYFLDVILQKQGFSVIKHVLTKPFPLGRYPNISFVYQIDTKPLIFQKFIVLLEILLFSFDTR